MMKKIIRFILGAVIFGVFIYWIGLDNLLSLIVKVNFWLLPVILLLFILQVLINSINIWLMSGIFSDLSFRKANHVNLLSWGTGFFIPGKLGQLSQIYFLKKNGLKTKEAITVTIVDKTISLVVLLIFSVIGTFFFLPEYFLALTVSLAVAIILIINPKGKEIINGLIKKYLPSAIGISETLTELTDKKIVLFADLTLTILRIILNTLFLFVVFIAFDTKVDFVVLFLMNCITQVISYIPITLNGLGIREGGFTMLASFMRIDKSIALLVISINTVIDYLAAAIISAYYSSNLLINIKREEGEKQRKF